MHKSFLEKSRMPGGKGAQAQDEIGDLVPNHRPTLELLLVTAKTPVFLFLALATDSHTLSSCKGGNRTNKEKSRWKKTKEPAKQKRQNSARQEQEREGEKTSVGIDERTA